MSNGSVFPRAGRRLFAVTVVLAAVICLAGTAGAAPAPPPNPSDSDIASGHRKVDQKAGAVGSLNDQLTRAESQLQQLSDDLALKRENANKALVDLRTAQGEADKATRDARIAHAQADAAGVAIERARHNLDEFAMSSLRQQRGFGSITAFIGAKNPKDVLARASLLNAISDSKLDALNTMQRARINKANADAAARAALRRAQRKQAQADAAKHRADNARDAAQLAQQNQSARTNDLQATRSRLQTQLSQAQHQVNGLEAQRQQYQDWLARKQAEDEARARAAAQQHDADARSGGGSSAAPAPAPSGGSVAQVIARARSVLGTPYAWGGGNGSGPTYGIHDGGVADAYGDYNKIGFDCSGLMVYAFAAAGVSLPHYSGYQYTSGTQVPLSQMRPGDMIFYGGAAGIHHVTLYLGGGLMIEAPESGSYVQVSTVRYGEIMPYVTRVL